MIYVKVLHKSVKLKRKNVTENLLFQLSNRANKYLHWVLVITRWRLHMKPLYQLCQIFAFMFLPSNWLWNRRKSMPTLDNKLKYKTIMTAKNNHISYCLPLASSIPCFKKTSQSLVLRKMQPKILTQIV